jgi:hypothetical protein
MREIRLTLRCTRVHVIKCKVHAPLLRYSRAHQISLGLASCLRLVQEIPYLSVASRSLVVLQKVLTRLLIEIENGYDRSNWVVYCHSTRSTGISLSIQG